jgi:hypothetical protein
MTRGFPWGLRPTYRGPRDQLTVDNFAHPVSYPQIMGACERDQLTVDNFLPLDGHSHVVVARGRDQLTVAISGGLKELLGFLPPLAPARLLKSSDHPVFC